jgi:hypothetical protein
MQGPDGYIYLGVEGKGIQNNQTKMIFSKQLALTVIAFLALLPR